MLDSNDDAFLQLFSGRQGELLGYEGFGFNFFMAAGPLSQPQSWITNTSKLSAAHGGAQYIRVGRRRYRLRGQVDVGTSEAAPNHPNGPARRPGWCDAMRRKHQRGYPGCFTRLASRYRSLFTLVWTFLALLSVPAFNGFAHAQSATHRGTEEGTGFSLSNAATSPQGAITSIQGTGKFSNEPIASLTFALQAVAPEDEIQATVTFSEPVDVERTPRLMLKVGDRDRPAGYLEGTGTTELVFGYEVVDGDEDTDGVSIEANRLSLNADPVLWYAMPAASWNEALPVGNGRLAGMVFGNTGRERIQLNEDTLWAGAPHQRDILGAHRHLPEIRRLLFAGRYVDAQAMVNRELFIGGRVVRAYQTLGDLWIDLGTESQAGYRRELDLETGIARTEWTRDGVAFTREVFASAPHGVLVVRIEADTPGAITGTVELTRPVDATTTAAGTELVLEGRASHGGQQLGVRFQARLRAVAEGGSVVAEGASLRLSGADAVTLILAAATDYRGTAPGPDAVRQVEAAEATGYTALREAHVADHRAIFNRVWLELGGSEWRREPTDTRLRFVRSGGEDTDLEAMYFQFGRYLLMASSRPGTMPANLQGVWNGAVKPPWNSDYHININIQMIYWPADVANLSEMQEPLWDMLDRLRERGRATARDHYGFERGFVAHHTTDAWWWTSPVGSARYGMWPSGGAWLSRHMWEAYLFNRDAAFLRERAYPVLKEAAEFFLDWLVPEPGTDLLLSGPSISPENAFRINGRRTHVTMGPAMDQQIVRDLFENVLAAAAELGIDDAFTQETAAKLTKLAGPQVGTDGRLMEWRQEELVEADPGHRHISHAFGLYPGSQFTVRGTPDLAAAVRKSIEHRVANGGGGTGWSLGWLLNMWARLEAGGKAYSTLRRLLTDMTMDNLLDLHPLLAGTRTNVFQMDGNLGGTAGIAEMLLQSHAGEIHLLPALPRQWSRGVVEGLKARGGFEVSMAWSDGALTTVSIRSRSGEECRVRVAGGEVRTLAVGMGETRWFDGQLSEVRAPQGLGAPRDVAVTGSTPTSLSLSVTWQPPLFEGRSVYGYDVQYAKRGESGFREWPHRGRAPGTTITGLERDAAWKVRVRARNASGPGAWSSAVEYTGDIVAPPVIDTIEITSNPGPDATYAAGDTIEVTVTFNETVKVEGTPRLTLRVGIRNRTAGYLRGTDTAALVFGYEVADGDEDTGGVSIEAGRIALNGGTIEDEAENAAELAHEALATQAGHKVDGVRPAFSSAAVDGASLTLTYGEALDGGSRPAPGDFSVEVDGSGRSVSAVSVRGSVVTLTLDPAVEHGDTGIRASYSPGTRPIRDAVGNDALGLSSQSVANTTGAPNTAPEITSPGSFDVPENQVLVRRLAARDDDPGDEVTGWEIVGGADQGKFSIHSTSGALTFKAAPNFEDPSDADTDGRYQVTVRATSGADSREKTATQAITVAVADVGGEKPAAPSAPNVSAASVTSLSVTWSAPANAGPAVTDYDYRHRTALPEGSWTEVTNTAITGLATTIGSLAENTSYDVQVRATNGEGTGGWSASGSGATDADPLSDAPALDVAMVKGAELELRFDRPLDELSVPAPEDFTVVLDDGAGTPLPGVGRYAGSGARGRPLAASAAGVRGTTLAVTAVEVRGMTVVLTLEREVPHGTRVTVSYTPGATPLRDLQGMAVLSIGDVVAVETALSVVDAAADEGDWVRFPVRLSRAVASAVTVNWALTPGSATPGTDYTGSLAGSLIIEPEATTGTIAVPTAPDAAVEGDETFTLTLTEPLDFPHWALLKTAMATGTIKDDDDPGGTDTGGTGTGGGSGGGGANRPPVVERAIPAQTLEAGETLELDIRLNFYDRDQRALDYSVESADRSVATVTVDRNGVLTIRGMKRGVTAVTVTAADRRDERASDTFAVTVEGPALVALVPRASDLMREGFVRVINHAAEAGEVSIEAVDDTGVRLGPVTLSIEAGATVHFNSGDLEDGNAAKGLPEGVGSGEGDWRLILESDLDFEVLSYIRTGDGFLTAMHDTVPMQDGTYRVAVFNPGSNPNQVSRLRLVNPGAATTEVTVSGVDDAGASPGSAIEFEIPAGQSLTLTASDLEAGAGVDGALGDGAGKWRLQVTSNEPIVAMSLLSSPTGHLTNLSTVPAAPGADGTHVVPLFPSASDPLGLQGFVRMVNRSIQAGTVQIEAYDDSDTVYETVALSLGAGATAHFNSNDLELGSTAKGLSGSTGAGVGDWRLVLSSELDIDVLAYIRTPDGFLTSMHDVAPRLEGVHRVAIFNPGSNPNQISRLRLVNPGTEDAAVTIAGIDDAGVSPGGEIVLTIPAGASRTLDAETLESGGEGIAGALNDGAGKWRLTVDSDQPIVVMSLLSSPTGHLTNLSTAPDRGGL